MLTFQLIQEAAARIADRINHTPVMTSPAFNEASGKQVFFKCENLQRAGAFKFRGATNRILSLTDAEKRRGVIAVSSGNHAQAVALAAREAGVRAVVAIPADAPKMKVAALEIMALTFDSSIGYRMIAKRLDTTSPLEKTC